MIEKLFRRNKRLVEQAGRARQAPKVKRPVDTVRKPAAPIATKPVDVGRSMMLDHLDAVHQNTRDQLAILRQTRPQRDVGALTIPAHLQHAMPVMLGGRDTDPNSTGGVETRNALPAVGGPDE